MNDLAHLVHFAPDLSPCPLEPGLAQVDSVSQHRTAGMNSLGIWTFLELNAFPPQKLAEILIKLIFLDLFHR